MKFYCYNNFLYFEERVDVFRGDGTYRIPKEIEPVFLYNPKRVIQLLEELE